MNTTSPSTTVPASLVGEPALCAEIRVKLSKLVALLESAKAELSQSPSPRRKEVNHV